MTNATRILPPCFPTLFAPTALNLALLRKGLGRNEDGSSCPAAESAFDSMVRHSRGHGAWMCSGATWPRGNCGVNINGQVALAGDTWQCYWRRTIIFSMAVYPTRIHELGSVVPIFTDHIFLLIVPRYLNRHTQSTAHRALCCKLRCPRDEEGSLVILFLFFSS